APRSATVIPGLMPSKRTSWPGSPASSRAFSSFQIGLTMWATGRSGFGNELAGAPDCAMDSCAAPETVNEVAKTAVSAARIITVRMRVLNGPGAHAAKGCSETSAEIGSRIAGVNGRDRGGHPRARLSAHGPDP